MRNKFFMMIALVAMLAACKKDNECPYSTSAIVASATEVANLKLYLDTNSLPYTQHPSGMFYNVLNPGSGTTPGMCSDVTVKYHGKLTNGSAFDSSYLRSPNGAVFTLGTLIPGWKVGIPLIKKGGAIILYIPPSLGYGPGGSGTAVPPNSNLIFNIELIDVQD